MSIQPFFLKYGFYFSLPLYNISGSNKRNKFKILICFPANKTNADHQVRLLPSAYTKPHTVHNHPTCLRISLSHGLQVAGMVDVLGLVHSGPRLVI